MLPPIGLAWLCIGVVVGCWFQRTVDRPPLENADPDDPCLHCSECHDRIESNKDYYVYDNQTICQVCELMREVEA